MKLPTEQLATQINCDPGSNAPLSDPDAGKPVDLRMLKHDLKNQVTSILCFCSLLRQSSVDMERKQVAYIDQIQSSTKAILLLLNELDADNRPTDSAVKNQPDPVGTD